MAKLPSSVFLEKHFENGGLSQQAYKSLKIVIGMISEMGRETHVILEGRMAFAASRTLFEGHSTRISQVCNVFRRRLRDQLVIIESAANTLPDLKEETEDELEDELVTWNNKLRALHVPDGNDKSLFHLIFLHYEATVHQRLLCLHQCRSEFGLQCLVTRCTELRHALKELYQIAEAADQLVADLRAVYERGREGLIPVRQSTAEEAEKATVPSSQFTASETGEPSHPCLTNHLRAGQRS